MQNNYSKIKETGNIINYIHSGLKIDISQEEGLGRGVFATKNIRKGELLVVERPIAYVESDMKLIGFSISENKTARDIGQTKLITKLTELAQLKGL